MSQIITERSEATWQRHLLSLALAAFTALIVCYCIDLITYTARCIDQSWYLYAAQRLLAGAHIYGSELVDPNPPLIIWFSVVPAFLGHLLHLDTYLMLKVVVFLMIIGSVAWCARTLRISGIAQSRTHLLIGIASVLSAEIFMSGYVLGEREHLVVILILPYILSAVLSMHGKQSRPPFAELCALGVAAGVAVCFKPQQVLMLAGLELFLAAWRRTLKRLFSPDFLCAALAIFLYIELISVAAPRYLSATMPLARETYWAVAYFSTWDLIKQEPVFDVLFILTALILILSWKKLRMPIVPGAFLACSLAASVAYCAQHTGSSYRLYPQDASLLLAILWIAMDLAPDQIIIDWKLDSTFAVSMLIFALLLVPASIAIGRTLEQFESLNWGIPRDVFAQYPPETPVLVLSTALGAFPTVEHSHLIWASRAPCLWMLPAIIQNEVFQAGGPRPKKILPPALVGSLAAQTRTETAEDFRRWKPSVVMVEQCHKSHSCWGLRNIDFDTLNWFLRSPAFAAEWSHYTYQSSRNNLDIYTRTR